MVFLINPSVWITFYKPVHELYCLYMLIKIENIQCIHSDKTFPNIIPLSCNHFHALTLGRVSAATYMCFCLSSGIASVENAMKLAYC